MTSHSKYYLILILFMVCQLASSQHQYQLEFTSISQVELKSEYSVMKALGVHPQNSLSLQYNHTDGLNINHKRYKQTIAGYPVEGAVIATHQYKDGKTTANGLWLTDMNPVIPSSDTSRPTFRYSLEKWEIQVCSLSRLYLLFLKLQKH